MSLPALLATNYLWLSTTNWSPPLIGLSSPLALCHAVKSLAPPDACTKMAIITTAIHPPFHPPHVCP